MHAQFSLKEEELSMQLKSKDENLNKEIDQLNENLAKAQNTLNEAAIETLEWKEKATQSSEDLIALKNDIVQAKLELSYSENQVDEQENKLIHCSKI